MSKDTQCPKYPNKDLLKAVVQGTIDPVNDSAYDIADFDKKEQKAEEKKVTEGEKKAEEKKRGWR